MEEHWIIPFHFPEVRYGIQFSSSLDIPSLLLDLTLQTVERNDFIIDVISAAVTEVQK
jgi:hypothetical protein